MDLIGSRRSADGLVRSRSGQRAQGCPSRGHLGNGV